VVRVGAELRTETHTMLAIRIRDTGIGISPDKQDRLFAPFTQVDTSDTRKYGGTGLGLAITKKLTLLMDGEIGVESTPGEGSTFWVTVLLEHDAQAGPKVPPPPEIIGKRVLVVDGVESEAKAMEHQLAAWGMQTDVALNTPQALGRAHACADVDEPVELLVVARNIIEESALAHEVRLCKDPLLADLPTVVVGVSAEQQELIDECGLNVRGLVMTPVRQAELFREAARALGAEYNAGPQYDNRREISVVNPVGEERPLRVLLVEDVPMNQEVAVNLLHKVGYQVDIAKNGREACEILDSFEYDVVLMDCQMPVMDGYEATEQIRKREERDGRHVPIIAMTADAMTADRERCLNVGMDDFVPKPISPDKLFAAIERVYRAVHPEAETETIDTSTPRREPPAADAEPAGELPELAAAPVDFAAAVEERGGWEMVRMLLDMYCEEVTGRIESMAECLERDDAAQFGREAHVIKGGSAEMKAKTMRALALELEKMGKAGDISGAEETFQQLVTEFSQLKQFLEQHGAALTAEFGG
jgi:CheY-like chemotaxis protein/HPt (histidine-containing phosphotransfer) domain-containing protein